MPTEIVVAIVAAVATLVSSVISAIVSNKMIEWRLRELERKVDEHNGYAKKFAELTTDIKWIREMVKK